jgi:cation diffusion facilitator family transporter
MIPPLAKTLEWFGFGGADDAHDHSHGGHGHFHRDLSGHGHTHGVIDPSLTTTARGIWAIKWSFAILAVTAALQLMVVFVSGSVALLADTIHNIGDATTAIPLWVAFVLARRKPSKTFTYGLGRVEDLAGILIVLIILFSALVAGYEAIDRLIHPQPVAALGWLAAAGFTGFIGNEAVAVFRIRVGRQMNSAALIADGYHARIDGLTSLAVVLGAAGVWLGYPLADPVIGILITLAIFGIVWQSARAVITRTLDGVEPSIVAEIRHAIEHVAGAAHVVEVKARWLGHQLHAEIAIAVDKELSVGAVDGIVTALKQELHAHLPALRSTSITFEPSDRGGVTPAPILSTHGHHHAPEPFRFSGELAEGVLEIIDTAEGERMRLSLGRHAPQLSATVIIARSAGNSEALRLVTVSNDHHTLQSVVAPAEPHEFTGVLYLTAGGRQESLPFRMSEPAGHHH